MSILPANNPSSESSSSSQSCSQNSNPNHGLGSLRQQPQQPLSQSPPFETQFLHSLQISNPVDASNGNSGEVASSAQDSSGSSKKVNAPGKPNGKKFVARQNNGRNSHSNAAARGGVGFAQHGENQSGIIVSPRSQQISGSINFQTSSTHSSGRKTQVVNGNHLLNFHYDPISRPQPSAPPPRRHAKRKPYNKDLFLQANYKFIVLDSGNYAPESLDPDKMLRWEDIICVRFSTPFPVQCPICLDDPLCPQITSCGHIFCFPCILRYFFMGEDDCKGECWKKCPLCFMMISSKDLYTIYIENVKQNCVGDTAEFMLLTRQKDSFTLSLKNKQGVGTNEEVPDSFSKFTFTSDVNLSVTTAISDLDSWLARADSGLVDDLEKLPYVCAAMEQLEQRRKYWNEQQVGHVNTKAYKGNDFQTGLQGSWQTAGDTNDCREPFKLVWGSLSTGSNGKSICVGDSTPNKLDGEACLDQIVDVVESLEDQEGALSSSYEDIKCMHGKFNDLGDRKDKDSYNFYQAVDGQHLILHPLNMKCLLHHYGSYDMLPHRISGKILQLETVTQSQAMRRRYRFLSHFSLTTTFQLCEVDLSESLPPNALSPFMDEIKNRGKQRKRLARKEREDKIRAEAATTDYVPIEFNFAQNSYDDSPSFSMDDFEALGSPAVTSSSPPTVGERKLFSSVARLGFAAGHDSPALKIDDSHSLRKPEGTNDSSDAIGSSNSAAGTPSFANIISRANTLEGLDSPNKMNEMGKKGKKPSRVLLSTAGGRRY